LGLELEGAQTGQRFVEVSPLALELLDALGDPLEPQLILRYPGRVGLVQAQVLADFVDRKSEPPQSLDDHEARPILIIEDTGAAHACRRNQPALLIETNALGSEGKLVGKLGDAVEPRAIGRR